MTTQAQPTTAPRAFKHPGGLHTLEDLDRMKSKVAAKEHPWIDGWNRLIEDPKAQNNYRPAPNDHMGSRQRAQDDARSAYLNALRWYISGDTSHADCAVRTMNAWANTVSKLPSGPDQPGLSGIPIGTFAVAAEVLRQYPGWQQADQEKFKGMLLNYFYPVCHDFLVRHNDAPVDHYWANWDTANILAIMAIGVYCDDRAKFDEAIEYFKNGKGNGSIKNAVYFLHPDGLGQWQEAGRDHAHALGGLGLLAEACQVAWNQGIDLYSWDNNRLLSGAEYEAQYTMWKGVPYKHFDNSMRANQMYISPGYHGRLGNCEFYELLYNHYVVRMGLKAPNTKKFAELLRPEGGNADLKGYGTLTYTLDAVKSPYPAAPIAPVPQDVIAKSGVGRIEIRWSPSGAYSAQGYEIFRATLQDGPFESIFATRGNTSPVYLDTKVSAGVTYYYKVAALNQSGSSQPSQVVSARPAEFAQLPTDWIETNIASQENAVTSRYSPAANGTISISGFGDNVGNTADSVRFVYQKVSGDFTITARLIDRGTSFKTGIMMRDSADAGCPAVVITLGELGGRQARFGARSEPNQKMKIESGNDYTSPPAWMRIQRVGDLFTGYQSLDGITWHAIGNMHCKIGKDYLAGVMLCSGRDKKEASTTTFDHLTMEIKPPAPPQSPGDLTVRQEQSNRVLKWKNPSGIHSGTKIECAIDDQPFYEIADLDASASQFTNTGLDAKHRYSYRIRAYNTGGYSAYSREVKDRR